VLRQSPASKSRDWLSELNGLTGLNRPRCNLPLAATLGARTDPFSLGLGMVQDNGEAMVGQEGLCARQVLAACKSALSLSWGYRK
jgi:hypothetical protein